MELVRVNTRISQTANEWLNKESKATGITKSTLILLAVENYKREKEAFGMMADMGDLVAKIDELERAIKRDPK